MREVASKARQVGMIRAFAAAFSVMVAVALLMTTASASFAYSIPAAPVISSPPEGSYDNDGAFILKGSSAWNTVVKVYVDGSNYVGQGRIMDASGRWEMPLRGVADGKHTYRAKATSLLSGVSSGWSNTRTVIVDTKAPAAPYLAPYFSGDFAYGTAEPNSKVELFVWHGETTSLGTVQADAQGKWRMDIPISTWDEGNYVFKARATDLAGNVSGWSDERIISVVIWVGGFPYIIDDTD